MNLKTSFALFILLTGLAAAQPALAMKVLTADDLASMCLEAADPGVDISEACGSYIRGFIDGAIATDPRVTENVANDLENETFEQRAARTRIGSRLKRYGPSYYAMFCIPDPVPLSEITQHVLTLLRDGFEGTEPAREVVYRVLVRDYPCEP
jgi:hypothetical protein